MTLLPSPVRRSGLSLWSRLEQMESELDRWARGRLPTFELPEQMGWTPPVDLMDADGEYIVTAELPGVKPDDVEVYIEEDVLTMKGSKKKERREEVKGRRLFEREYGSFERSFTLPRSVDAGEVRADFKNGVLTVHLPKREEAMGRKIEIESGE